MIYLDEAYDRDSFQQFLEDQFLPNDYRPTQLQEPLISRGLIKDILNLGTVPSLDNLQIFEVIHTAKADARVTLSNEMVKYMQKQPNHICFGCFCPRRRSLSLEIFFYKNVSKVE